MALCLAVICLASAAFVRPAVADQVATSADATTGDDPAVVALIAQADATYATAAGLSGTDKRQALLKVKAVLDKISDSYPASAASLAIALAEKVGSVDPAGLDAELAALGPEAATAAAPPLSPLADPVLKVINQCLTAGDPAPAGEAKVKLHLVTGDDGTISGMPDLVEPTAPSTAERQMFSWALLSLADCKDLAGAQHNSTVDFTVSSKGVEEGSVVMASAVQAKPDAQASDTAAPATDTAADTATAPVANTSPPPVTFTPATSQTQDALGLKRKDIAELQARLTAMGYDPKGIDGSTGASLRAAVGLWQTSAGIPSTGYLDGPQLGQLKAVSQPDFDTWKANADNAKLLAKASAPRKSGTQRGHNGWYYRSSDGTYCRMGLFGLWCQGWKPLAW